MESRERGLTSGVGRRESDNDGLGSVEPLAVGVDSRLDGGAVGDDNGSGSSSNAGDGLDGVGGSNADKGEDLEELHLEVGGGGLVVLF